MLNETNHAGLYIQLDASMYFVILGLCIENYDDTLVICNEYLLLNYSLLNYPSKLLNNRYYIWISQQSDDTQYIMTVRCNDTQSFAKKAKCYMENGVYICQCNGYEECMRSSITCKDDINCRVECQEDRSCYRAGIYWPKNAIGNILCNGTWSCYGITFPEPP
eukprot:411427_1